MSCIKKLQNPEKMYQNLETIQKNSTNTQAIKEPPPYAKMEDKSAPAPVGHPESEPYTAVSLCPSIELLLLDETVLESRGTNPPFVAFYPPRHMCDPP